MQKEMKILIVPYWVERAIRDNQLSMDAALDIMSLSRILSFKDVCFYCAINMWLYDELPVPVKDTFTNVHLLWDGLKYLMTDGSGNKPSKDKTDAFYERVSNQYHYEYDRILSESQGSGKRLLLSLLPHDTAQDDPNVMASTEYLFEVFDIKDDVLGIRFALPDKHIPLGKQIKQCYDNLLKVLTASIRFEEVVKLPAFNEFARLSRTGV